MRLRYFCKNPLTSVYLSLKLGVYAQSWKLVLAVLQQPCLPSVCMLISYCHKLEMTSFSYSIMIVPVCTLTHWGRVTYIYVGKLIIIGSDNGLSPDRSLAIIWTNAWLLSIGHLRTYFTENLINVQQFSLKKMHVKMSSAKWCPSCLGLNLLILS